MADAPTPTSAGVFGIARTTGRSGTSASIDEMVTPAAIEDDLEVALAGRVAASVRLGDQSLGVRVRAPDAVRFDAERLGALPIISGPGRRVIPLSALVSVRAVEARAEHLRENQRQLMQTPGPLSQGAEPDVEGARLIIESALAEGRHLLSEVESKALLSAFRIPVAQTLIARNPTEAMLMAQQLGFPVVMKINSPNITHKSDVGGVKLSLSSGQAVRSAFSEMSASAVSNSRLPARISCRHFSSADSVSAVLMISWCSAGMASSTSSGR